MKTPVLVLAGLATVTTALNAKELDGVYQPTSNPCPTVAEQIKKVTLPPGYELRNFAAEPMVINPVAMTWDARGRLWVVELYEYPSGAKSPNEYSKTATDETFRPVVKADVTSPRDRIIVLEDTDNDGAADKRTVFAEGLNLATAILCGHGGVFVGQAPNLLFFRDTDGDDKADEYKTVLTGFGLEDRHELLNSFTWGPDGLMYFTHGVFTHSKVRRPVEPEEKGFTLNAGIFRVAFDRGRGLQATRAGEKDSLVGREAGAPFPVATRYEVFADGTSNPWGCDYDAAGNWFVEACVIDHLFHMAAGGFYQRQGGAPENPYAYELLPSIVNHKHFRAAYAGIQVYQGGAYPEDTDGHLFFGNIHDNSIHEEKVEPVGATFKASPVRDFLRANDGWFRPVSIQTGPDGFLWVMDWCDKYPCYQNAQANPEGVDRERGRIWRICHAPTPAVAGAAPVIPSRPEKDMNFAALPADQLVKRLGDANSWVRRTARTALVQDSDDQKIDAIVSALAVAASDIETYELLSAIQGSKRFALRWFAKPSALDEKWRAALEKPLASKNPAIVAKALTVFDESSLSVEVRADNGGTDAVVSPRQWMTRLSDLARDSQPAVASAIATVLRLKGTEYLTTNQSAELKNRALTSPIEVELQIPLQELGRDVLEQLIRSHSAPPDQTLPFQIWMSFEPRLASHPKAWAPWLATLAPTTKPLSLGLTYKTMRRLCDTRKPENLDLAFGYLDTVGADGDLLATALDGLVKGQEAGAIKPTRDPAPYFATWSKHEREDVRRWAQQLATLWGDPKAVVALMGTVLDERADVAQRIEAIRTVRRLKSDAARAGMVRLLEMKSPDPLTIEALRAAGELGGMDLANGILKSWSGYPPAVRTAAAEVFVTRGDWASRLLDAVEGKWVASGKINPSDIPVSVRRRLAQDDALKIRAEQLLGRWNESGADVRALIAARKKACLDGEPDLAAGKAIFTVTCAVCHPFHGGGQEVGPNLIGSGRSNLDALLANVIDPNQIIGNGYQNFVVSTRDGRTLSGRVMEDTPTQVTLLGLGGARQVVPRGEIAEMKDTGQSTMPMGFGALPDDVFRNLIWYILAPPEEGPLTKERKAALSASVDGEGSGGAAGGARTGATSAPASGIDWESVSLWNPDWKVEAPEFEGTPARLVDFAGKKNVLQLHPFPKEPRTKPARLVRSLKLPADRPRTLSFDCASHDQGDWELVVRVNGEVTKKESIHPDGLRWKHQEVSLEKWKGRPVEISLENHATDWSFEFSYWADLQVK